MSQSLFGWELPPGVSARDIDGPALPLCEWCGEEFSPVQDEELCDSCEAEEVELDMWHALGKETALRRRDEQITHYGDMLLRWLRAQRDYPWNNEPEPALPLNLGSFGAFAAMDVRERLKREFARSA